MVDKPVLKFLVFKNVLFAILALALLVVFIVVFLVFFVSSDTQPFTTVRKHQAEKVEKIIQKYGGINNIRYEEFISEFPEGNNVMYMKLKNSGGDVSVLLQQH